MDFSGRQQESGKKFIGLGLVIILHFLIGLAFLTGLANHIGPQAQKLMEAVLDKPEPPPPPPDAPPPPPPKLAVPPPPFIPPPEVQVQQTPAPNAISAVSNVKPETNVMTKVAAPVVEQPKAPAGPSVIPAHVDFQQAGCKPEYPRASLRNEESGITRLSVTVGADGSVTDVQIAKSSGFRGLDNAVKSQLMSGSCRNKPGTVDGKPQATTAVVDYVWKID